MTGKQRTVFFILGVLLVVSRLWIAFPVSWAEMPLPTDWRTLEGDEHSYVMPARNLLAGRGYSSSVEAPYEPSILRTPTYPLLLTLLFGLFGARRGVVVTANIVFDVATGFLLFAIARRFMSTRWALGCLGLVVLLAPWTRHIHAARTESIATFLFVLVLWLATGALQRARHWLALGLAVGLLIMCRPNQAVLAIVAVAWACSPWAAGPRAPLRVRVAALLLSMAIPWGPWIVRNAIVFDRFVPLAPAGGVAIWLSNWYGGGGGYWSVDRRADGTIERVIPDTAFVSRAERDLITANLDRYIEEQFRRGGPGVFEPNDVFTDVGVQRIRADPGNWLAVGAGRTGRMLYHHPFWPEQWIYHLGRLRLPFAILAVLTTLMVLRRPAWHFPLLSFWGTWAVHFPTHGEPRYLVPAYGVVFLLVTMGASIGVEKLRGVIRR